jgi:hypothetical protein
MNTESLFITFIETPARGDLSFELQTIPDNFDCEKEIEAVKKRLVIKM